MFSVELALPHIHLFFKSVFMFLSQSDSFFGRWTPVSLMFGVELVKRNVLQGHTALRWREQMLQSQSYQNLWINQGHISIFKDLSGIGCAPTFFTLWNRASWGLPGPPKDSKMVVFGEGAQQARALCLLCAMKAQIKGFDLNHNLLSFFFSHNLKNPHIIPAWSEV